MIFKMSLIESLNNGTENYVLKDDGDISIYLDVNTKKNSDGTFELSQSHLVEKLSNKSDLKCTQVLKQDRSPLENRYFIKTNLF